MLEPSRMSPRVRRIAARLVHRAWGWASAVGTLSPDDDHGFRRLGEGSLLGFPPGDVLGQWWIEIGARTLIAADVTLTVGLPGETLDRSASPVVTIGDRCSIGRGSAIVARQRVEIGDDVMLAPHVYVTDHNHAYGDVSTPIKEQYPSHDPVRIGDGSWLGVGVTVLPGASIGRHVTVGAGAVVRGEVPDHSVIAGNPARIVRRYVDGSWDPPLTRPTEDWPE